MPILDLVEQLDTGSEFIKEVCASIKIIIKAVFWNTIKSTMIMLSSVKNCKKVNSIIIMAAIFVSKEICRLPFNTFFFPAFNSNCAKLIQFDFQ